MWESANKLPYQTEMRNWYEKERSKYKAQKILKKAQTECQKKYGIDKYYTWNGS